MSRSCAFMNLGVLLAVGLAVAACAPGESQSDVPQGLINAVRAEEGLGAIAANPRLNALAASFAYDVARTGDQNFRDYRGQPMGARLGALCPRSAYAWFIAAEMPSNAAAIERFTQSTDDRGSFFGPDWSEFGWGVSGGVRVLVLGIECD